MGTPLRLVLCQANAVRPGSPAPAHAWQLLWASSRATRRTEAAPVAVSTTGDLTGRAGWRGDQALVGLAVPGPLQLLHITPRTLVDLLAVAPPSSLSPVYSSDVVTEASPVSLSVAGCHLSRPSMGQHLVDELPGWELPILLQLGAAMGSSTCHSLGPGELYIYKYKRKYNRYQARAVWARLRIANPRTV